MYHGGGGIYDPLKLARGLDTPLYTPLLYTSDSKELALYPKTKSGREGGGHWAVYCPGTQSLIKFSYSWLQDFGDFYGYLIGWLIKFNH